MNVHLFDGTYELFRAWFGAPQAQHGGREVGATRAFLRSLAGVLRTGKITHAGVAFDHVIESFRNELFAGYKTGDGVDPELMAQFHPAEGAADALGLVVWPMVHYEADDALATAAARFAGDPGVEQVVICSPDKDLAQCVSGARVVCRDRRRRLDRDEAAVVERFGVRPGSIPDWLALVGDTADGIPGIPGWGEKSAGAVLHAYERLEAIPDHAHGWTVEVRGRERLAASLAQRREEAGLYRQLATLCREVPLAEELADLEWRGPRAGFPALCRSLGAPELVERLPRAGR